MNYKQKYSRAIMKHGRFFMIALAVCFAKTIGFSQQEFSINQKLQWKDICYDPYISSIQLFKGDNEQSVPLLELGKPEVLTLWFDDLAERRPALYYTIVHCNADWEEDNLYVGDYLNGFAQNPLPAYQLSRIARSRYAHYALTIPNREVQLKVSGNYLLKVYEKNPSQPLFIRGFSIMEPRVNITAKVRPPLTTGASCQQQLEFSLQHPGLDVRNAFTELKVRVEQNGYRIPNAKNPEPTFVEQSTTNYAQADRLWYEGVNEYRTFDIRTLEFGALGVSRIRMDDDNFYYAQLTDDSRRIGKVYTFNNDLDGQFRIDAYRRQDRQTEAEYVTAIFTLIAPVPYDYANVYVFGGLTNNTLDSRFRMEYNTERGAYELNVPLKQGYYNYRYLLVGDDGKIMMDEIEGCFSETQNTYNIFVYYRSPRDRYDRLVGFSSLNSLVAK